MSEKYFIDAQTQQQDAFQLAVNIMQSDFRPTFIVGIWRGGAAIGATVQELLACCGYPSDHIAIRTSSYSDINKRSRNIRVHGLGYLEKRLTREDSLLLVDDVHDTGLSLREVLIQIDKRCLHRPKDIRIATLYYKPSHSQVDFKPDFYLHESDQWLVFPHEIQGLTAKEIASFKPDIAPIKDWLLAHNKNGRQGTTQE